MFANIGKIYRILQILFPNIDRKYQNLFCKKVILDGCVVLTRTRIIVDFFFKSLSKIYD